MIIHEYVASAYSRTYTGLHYTTNRHKKKGYFKIIDHKKWISEKQEAKEAGS